MTRYERLDETTLIAYWKGQKVYIPNMPNPNPRHLFDDFNYYIRLGNGEIVSEILGKDLKPTMCMNRNGANISEGATFSEGANE